MGRSPLEYLDAAERIRQRNAVLSHMLHPPDRIVELIAILRKKTYAYHRASNCSEILDSRGRPTVQGAC